MEITLNITLDEDAASVLVSALDEFRARRQSFPLAKDYDDGVDAEFIRMSVLEQLPDAWTDEVGA